MKVKEKDKVKYEKALSDKNVHLAIEELNADEKAAIKGYVISKALKTKRYRFDKQSKKFI